MNVTGVKRLETRLVVKKKGVIGVGKKVEAANGNNDLTVGGVDVDEIRRTVSVGLRVGDAF